MSRAWIPFLLCAGCELYGYKNPNYCPENPGNNCTLMWDGSVDTRCTGDPDCAAPTPACDLAGTMTCVQCTASNASACSGSTPVCGDAHACRACVAHSECASNVCRPDGTCSDGADVAYVDPAGTDNATCTQSAPCTRVAKALATNRPLVKFRGTTDEAVTLQGGRSVTLLAEPGSVLTRGSGSGPIVSVQDDNTSLSVFDLSISNAPNNASGRGILVQAIGSPSVTLTRATVSNNPGGGISASAGTLTVTRSTISGNSGGGISISGAQFELTNNMIVKNGGATSAFGGVVVSQITTAGTHRFAFNSVAQNQATGAITPGVLCSVIATPLSFANNIVFGNSSGTQVEGANCTWSYSAIGPMAASGTGNINQDPNFVNAAQNNFHIMANSPCKDAADPTATLNVDIDGDSRPQGSRRDIGADEAM